MTQPLKKRGGRPDVQMGDRLPPHSVEAERGVLGCCLLAPGEALPEAIAALKRAEVFYDMRHQLLFRLLVKMHDANTPIDLLIVAERLRNGVTFDDGERVDLEQVGGVAYLSSLMDAVPSAANLAYYADIVAEKKVLRDYLRLAARITQETYAFEGEIKQFIGSIEAEFTQIGEGTVESSSESDFRDHLPKLLDELEEFRRGKRQMKGLPSGFNYLDNMVCGFRPGEVYVFAARPSQGKTSLMTQILEHLAVDLKIPVGLFSLEMTSESLVARQVFSRAGANFQKYRNGFLLESDVAPLGKAIGEFNDKKVVFKLDEKSGLTGRELRIKLRRWKRKYGIKAAGIDYLQLMAAEKEGRNRNEEVGMISRMLKEIAKELGIPIFLLAQMNRNIESKDRQNKLPQLSDLRESGDIEQDADFVAFLYKVNTKAYEDNPDAPEMQWVKRFMDRLPAQDREVIRKDFSKWKKYFRRINLMVEKQRNGPTGPVELVYLNWLMRFEDMYTPAERERMELAQETAEGGGEGGPMFQSGGDRELPSNEEMWPEKGEGEE